MVLGEHEAAQLRPEIFKVSQVTVFPAMSLMERN
jgi:hypothetical protein